MLNSKTSKVEQHLNNLFKKTVSVKVKVKIICVGFILCFVEHFCAGLVMPRGIPISKDLRQRVVNAFMDGAKQVDISKQFVLPRYSISKIISLYSDRGHLEKLPKSGRPKKTTILTDRRIKRIATNDPWKSAPRIIAEIPEITVGIRTVQRRLVDAKLFSRRPAKKTLISVRNRAARLAFARRHLNWTVDDWKKVLFSDETRYKIFNSDGMRRVRRPINTRFNPKYVTPTIKHGKGNVMLWGCFSWNGAGPIHFINETMDRFVYRNIMQNVMLPFAEWEMPLRFIFQQDNDPKHSSQVVQQWFRENNVRVLQWPAQSPDLNPIENLWEEVERRIRTQMFPNKQSLIDKISEVWTNLPENVIKKLIESMPRRCQQVIHNNGYSINY